MSEAAAIAIKDYVIEFDENGAMVNGPNAGMARLIAARFALLVKMPIGRKAMSDQYAVKRIGELFNVPFKSSCDPASEAQREYAAGLGFLVPPTATKDEVGYSLSDFEQVRFFVYHVFRTLHGDKPSTLGVQTSAVNSVVRGVLRQPELTAKVRATMVLADAHGKDKPTKGNVFAAVSEVLAGKIVLKKQ